MKNRTGMQFLRRQKRKSFLQIKSHLVTENRERSCSCSVIFLRAVIEDVPKKVEILAHTQILRYTVSLMLKTVTSIGASLPLLFLKEGKSFIAYSPALDLSASGTTIAKAKKSFEQIITLFFEELVERGTLEEVLRDMGWFKQNSEWQPPIEIQEITSVSFRLPVAA